MKLSISLLFSVFLLVSSCSSERTENRFTDDELMLKVPSSELYIRVRGNSGKPLIVNLHGGPGGYSGIDIKLMGPGLEDKFLVAYLDQRGCGKSFECTDSSLLTVKQYVEDLDIVIDSLRNKYHKEKVNILGTSWGECMVSCTFWKTSRK